MMDPEEKREFTPEEEAKGRRALMILYIAMGIMIVAPFLVLFFIK